MGCLGFFAIPAAGAGFFLSSWILMIFWGIMADDVGVETISYNGAMLVTIGLWLVMAPLIATIAGKAAKARSWRRWWREE